MDNDTSLKNAATQAAWCGDLKALRQALRSGVDVNTIDPGGHMPLLHLAIENWNPEAVDLLLENGADPDVFDGGGYPALVRAIDIEAQSCYSAMKPDSLGVMTRKLIMAGADVNLQDRSGKCPIDYAREFRNYEALWLLRDADAMTP